ncbi:MAG: tetratricopeptide repeat protein [Brotaphodocola sp.]
MMNIMFDLEQFYANLDEHYAAHDNQATEIFLLQSREMALNSLQKPNMAYVSVCNELACFYRGLSRWNESLETFSLAQQELEFASCQGTEEYATVLLNKAGTYRYMRDLDSAISLFRQAADILEITDGRKEILAGLYNNMGLVYLDLRNPNQALSYFHKALLIVQEYAHQIVEQGTTWNNLAAAYQAAGDQEKAKEAAAHAVSILSKLDCGVNPHYPAALNTRGTLAYQEGRYEQALADFQEALEKTKLVYGENVEYACGCENCAAVCRKLGKNAEAEVWMQKGTALRKKLGMKE